MPRVTVIIPTYNWATVLPYSIGSVLDQTFRDFELLVIGDGCTDESGEVVSAIEDRRVHWHNLPVNTKHQSGPNNEGLRLAAGELIAYLGHDDLWLPHHLHTLLEAIDDGARWARASFLSVAPDGPPTVWPDADATLRMRSPLAGPVWDEASTALANPRWRLLPPSSVVHDRALAVDAGGWRPPRDTGALIPQTDLWNRLSLRAGPPRRVQRVTSVKIPAASRRGVYKQRPSHEQAYWLERIRNSDDPEREIVQAAEQEYVLARPDHPGTLPRGPGATGARGLVRRLRSGLARRGLVSPPPPVSADDELRAVRKHKGLES
jgi:glycosyltransferase involved in cell wall biosynthesis